MGGRIRGIVLIIVFALALVTRFAHQGQARFSAFAKTHSSRMIAADKDEASPADSLAGAHRLKREKTRNYVPRSMILVPEAEAPGLADESPSIAQEANPPPSRSPDPSHRPPC